MREVAKILNDIEMKNKRSTPKIVGTIDLEPMRVLLEKQTRMKNKILDNVNQMTNRKNILDKKYSKLASKLTDKQIISLYFDLGSYISLLHKSEVFKEELEAIEKRIEENEEEEE